MKNRWTRIFSDYREYIGGRDLKSVVVHFLLLLNNVAPDKRWFIFTWIKHNLSLFLNFSYSIFVYLLLLSLMKPHIKFQSSFLIIPFLSSSLNCNGVRICNVISVWRAMLFSIRFVFDLFYSWLNRWLILLICNKAQVVITTQNSSTHTLTSFCSVYINFVEFFILSSSS
jgi:hypothetical protein